MMNEYREFHRNPLNLLIHIATVPLFLLSVLGAMVAPFTSYWVGLWSASVALGVYSLLLQRFGHSLEGAKPGSAGGHREQGVPVGRRAVRDVPAIRAERRLGQQLATGSPVGDRPPAHALSREEVR